MRPIRRWSNTFCRLQGDLADACSPARPRGRQPDPAAR